VLIAAPKLAQLRAADHAGVPPSLSLGWPPHLVEDSSGVSPRGADLVKPPRVVREAGVAEEELPRRGLIGRTHQVQFVRSFEAYTL